MKRLISLYIVALTVFIQPFLLHAEEINTNIRVVEHDNPNNGIECKICILDLNEKERIVDSTDEDGNFDGVLSCKRGEKIKINPVSTLYYPFFLKCPIKKNANIVRVTKVYYVANLENNALWLESHEKFGDAALVYNEIFARVKNFNPEKANVARLKVIDLTAKQLNYKTATNYDYIQKKTVASKEFVSFIKEHQILNKVKSTGKLDYNTLRSISHKDIGHFIYNAPKEEPF